MAGEWHADSAGPGAEWTVRLHRQNEPSESGKILRHAGKIVGIS